MQHLPVLTGAVALAAATAALCLHTRFLGRRCFAGLISIAVALSLFSVFAWTATAVSRAAPALLTWSLICAFAAAFALRLYRELQGPSPEERGEPARE